MFKKILIANRGEIAVRIIKACKELGIKSVAIYSEVDRESLHVKLADESYLVGPPPPLESYLNIGNIVNIIEKSKSDAVHPGYGFLAENAEFARKVEEAGATFIGPKPKLIQLMGNKLEARKTFQKAGVPVIPGTLEPVTNLEDLKKKVKVIGLPVLLKAALGGGGKGMRIVYSESELENAFDSVVREAKMFFADERIYVERFIKSPRHIEVQILRDHHENCVALGERDCSIQRRHQKLIEEAPSGIISKEQREQLLGISTAAMNKIGYTNAGTIEYLYDMENHEFYFLEMNTRIQVEHPVTEMVTGVDLVKSQILIAEDIELPFSQNDVNLNGHSIECRIYAEDPVTFIPSPGLIEEYEEPKGENIRVDSGVYKGWRIPLYYDPLISKVITWDTDRMSSIKKMEHALGNYKISGIKTNIPFHMRILKNPNYLQNDYDVYFVENKVMTELA